MFSTRILPLLFFTSTINIPFVETAIKSNAFRHAFAKKNIKVPEDLIEVVRKGLKRHALSAFVNAVEKATDVVETAWGGSGVAASVELKDLPAPAVIVEKVGLQPVA